MKITNVAVTWHEATRSSSLTRAPAHCVVRIDAGAELTGCAVVAVDVRDAVAALARECLIDADPRATTMLYERMSTACHRRDSAVLIQAVAALDIALWDLRSKCASESLWRHLGASRPRVNAHLRVAPGAANRAATAQQFGFRGAVLEIADAENPAADLACLRASLSQSSGAPPALMIDIQSRWSPKDAIRRVRALEREFDLTWIEAPTDPFDVRGLKRVSDGIRGAVCGGAGLPAVKAYASYLAPRCVDIVQIDIERIGITGALQVADAAFGYELPVTLCATFGNVGAHVAAAMPYLLSLEVAEPVADWCASDVRIENGWAIVGDRAGLGIDIETGSSQSA